MKFGDVVTAVATLTVISILLDSVLLLVFIPVNSYWGTDAAGIISILVASLIVGYVFAAKIYEESMRGAIGKIAVLFAFAMMFATLALFTNPYMGVAMTEGLESAFATGGWTTWDWVGYSQMIMVMMVALNVGLALVLGFIGLFAGSMLRKPKKS